MLSWYEDLKKENHGSIDFESLLNQMQPLTSNRQSRRNFGSDIPFSESYVEPNGNGGPEIPMHLPASYQRPFGSNYVDYTRKKPINVSQKELLKTII